MKKAPMPAKTDHTTWMRETNWPPGFVSQLEPNPAEVKRREAAERGRATQLANGHTGSIRNGLSRKSAAVLPNVEKARVSSTPKPTAAQMTVMARPQATLRGLARYYTGVACIVGHRVERYASNGGCCECAKLKWRERDQCRAAQAKRDRGLVARKGVAA